jgi:8-oxo-dGTP diphosphatase
VAEVRPAPDARTGAAAAAEGPAAAAGSPAAAGSAAAAPSATLDTAAWVFCRGGRVLAVRARGRTLVYVPGGKREPGETHAACVVREVREELGVELEPATLRPLAVFEAAADGHGPGARVRLTCFAADGRGAPQARGEVEEVAWLAYADRDRVAPVDRLLFAWLHDRGCLPGPGAGSGSAGGTA